MDDDRENKAAKLEFVQDFFGELKQLRAKKS